MTSQPCQSEFTAYLHTPNICPRIESNDMRGGNPVEPYALISRRFGEAGRIVTRKDVDARTACQAIIANDTRLNNARNRLVEVRECFGADRYEYFANNTTDEVQVLRLAGNITAFRASSTGTVTTFYIRLITLVDELE